MFTFVCLYCRFSSVDAGNIVRLLAPDICLMFSTIFILRLCKKRLRPLPQISLHENGIGPPDPEVIVGTFITLQHTRTPLWCQHGRVICLTGSGNV